MDKMFMRNPKVSDMDSKYWVQDRKTTSVSPMLGQALRKYVADMVDGEVYQASHGAMV
jgi:hypothetical protein